jgi:glycosyltransferase involved in cell wall biosynthesis
MPTPKVPTPKVSVVMPVYNTARYLGESVGSVLAQTFPDWELLAVDDGSTDDAPRILDDYAKRDPRVKVIHQANAGLSAARNAGMDVACGEYLCFLDDDDLLEPQALEVLCARADAERLDLLCYASRSFADGPLAERKFSESDLRYARRIGDTKPMSGPALWTAQEQAGDFTPVVWLWLLRRDFAAAHGLRFIPGILHEDYPFTMRALFFADRAAVLAQPLHQRRIREGSLMTGAAKFGHVNGRLAALREVLAMTREYPSRGGARFHSTLHTRTGWLAGSGAPREYLKVPKPELAAGLETLSAADRLLLEWTIRLGAINLREAAKCEKLEKQLHTARAENQRLRFRVVDAVARARRKLKRLVKR